MKVLLILGHPRPGGFSESMAEANMEGARKAGVRITYLKLYDLDYNIQVTEQKL